MSTARAGGFPRLWLRLDLAPGVSIGPGKAELLRGIDETGSISAAGRRIGMSYKRAWQLVDALNRHFTAPLVNASRGGAHGGGAMLTPLGRDVLAAYQAVQAAAGECAAATLDQLAERVAADGRPAQQ
ncbi:LysR family transcriptional regulator [Immundisolibacter sp.]|uniref:winged helix-turn-helix domain-containing protein n=1 Tax=Immundisolibacter sp. TaxID=1934948 RepID=UPI00263821D1|nr:LysR family transcriptional regulator [Immundisolibacter sp.]MDD3652118.1 LysR family transcriptional regulator [Immundisolibacter sp.]